MHQNKRTIKELQRQLEIEQAMEEVRNCIMAMQSPDDLKNIAIEIRQQIEALGQVDLEVCVVHLYEEGSPNFKSLAAIPDAFGKITCMLSLFPVEAMDETRLMMKNYLDGLGEYTIKLSRKKAWEWQKIVIEHNPDLASRRDEIIDNLKQTDQAEYWNFADFTGGSLLLVTHAPPNNETKEVLQRSAQVFDLAYRRFLDLKNAESQAREARIEAALERVRSRSMAMQISGELKDVIRVILDQLAELNINAEHAGIVVDYAPGKDWTFWVAETQDIPSKITVPFLDSVWDRQYAEAKEKRAKFFTTQLGFEEKNEFYRNLLEYIPGLAKKTRDFYMECPGLAISTAVRQDIGLYIENFTGTPYTEEENNTLNRFGDVFQQTYTRFLDLKKAEAQAREAQIEAALERVRSRTIGMQSSDDLREVVRDLNEQLHQLNFGSIASNIIILDRDTGDATYWVSGFSKDVYPVSYHVPFMDHHYYNALLEPWIRGDQYVVYEYSGQDKVDFEEISFQKTDFKDVPEESKKIMESLPQVVLCTAYFTYGALQVIGQEAISDEKALVLQRFSKVFDQTYTRFLDLQKAEAQARESEIQLALERVRARTMAMHKTDELQDVINTVYQQFLELGVATTGGAFITVNADIDSEIVCWAAGGAADYVQKFHIPFIDMPIYTEFVEGIKKGPGFFREEFTYEEKQAFFTELYKHSPYDQAPEETKKEVFSRTGGYTRSCVVSELTSIFIINHHGRVFTDEENEILKRMGKVFEQAYTRFLDLQKAETQAREAQIEAALERVRAKTMAMRNSEDVPDTVLTFFNEIMKLGLDKTIRCGIGLPKEDKRWEIWSVNTDHDKEVVLKTGVLNMDIHPMLAGSNKVWEDGDIFFSYEFHGDDVKQYYSALNNEPEYDFNADLGALPESQFFNGYYFKEGTLFAFTENPLTDEAHRVLEKFNNLFGQTYRRYLDLLKAEAQAREAQIEAALERVRARTMAMHDSQDVADTVKTLFQEVMKLGLDDSIRCGIGILEGNEGMETWSANADEEGDINLKTGMLNMTIHPMLRGLKKAWGEGEKDYTYEFDERDVRRYYTALNAEPDYPLYFDLNTLPDRQFAKAFCFTEGILFAFTENQLSEEADKVLRRFAHVFGQTYRRYLDLLKAEAQAREAQIEASLERVRARTMAMHKSEELGEVAAVLFQQIDSLGATPERLNIGIVKESENFIEWWSTEQGGRQINRVFKGSIDEPTTMSKVYTAWKEGRKWLELDQRGDELKQWIRYVTEVIGLPFDPSLIQERRVHSAAFFKHGTLLVSSPNPLPADSMNLLERFASVFEQTYTRFLDLQKAEQQAREAEIEAALERVRAKTMAMHNTDDIADTVVTFFEELLGLGLDESMRAGIGILSQSEKMKLWTASVPGTSKTILHSGFLDMSSHPVLQEVKRTWKDKKGYFAYTLEGTELKDYFQNLNEAPDYEAQFDLEKLPETIYHRSCAFEDGVLYSFTETTLPEDIIRTLERFAAVFGQTYTRYLDLQKAEQRARDSKIEAALERVRAKALAMHSSEDLRQTITTIFEELQKLEIQFIRLGLGLLNPDEPEGEIVTSRIGKKGEIIEVSGNFPLVGHPVLDGVYGHFNKQLDYFPVLKGDEINSYYSAISNSVDVQGFGTDATHYGCFLYFPEGCLYAWAAQPQSESQIEILKKFSRVVEITYRRFNDLVESEAREKEAVKQASLDRVRAEIASMRNAEDLERITPLIWKELTNLDVPFFRCGVFIVDEKEKKIHSYLSNPKGESLAVWQVGFGIIPVFDEMVKSWQKQEVFLIEWDRQGFLDFSQLLIEHGLVGDRERYQSGKDAPEHLVLHMLPFAQGMLYVGSQAHLVTDQMELVQSLANAFSVAYARYEDFSQLEKTLSDLKATQAQLIQSEKMASLGELTAGIAHEIKNPLNFVNNFSDVSRELLAELLEEMDKGDLEEVRALAGDVMHNLEKIVHHGQRADSIVKGMLQHSRSGDGKKEPTDLNELADEYLRLAYHGLRAKDKSFNATIRTDFDQAIEKVEVIPQDMGRVLLNLLTNAFHAVSERKASAPDGYDPAVWVETKKTAGGLEIAVGDNGGGIPDRIKDKIFQPFFTTKPTGQGTGLGLSLSYDIVKAHGGELKVETVEGEGTTFLINFKTTT